MFGPLVWPLVKFIGLETHLPMDGAYAETVYKKRRLQTLSLIFMNQILVN